MPKQNPYLIKENYKKVEEVREIKNEYPNFEEFMKTYEYDANLNYDDLSGGGIGEVKGYGPCNTCGNPNITFKLAMVLHC